MPTPLRPKNRIAPTHSPQPEAEVGEEVLNAEEGAADTDLKKTLAAGALSARVELTPQLHASESLPLQAAQALLPTTRTRSDLSKPKTPNLTTAVSMAISHTIVQ